MQRSENSNPNKFGGATRESSTWLIGGITNYLDTVETDVFDPGIVPADNTINIGITNWRHKHLSRAVWANRAYSRKNVGICRQFLETCLVRCSNHWSLRHGLASFGWAPFPVSPIASREVRKSTWKQNQSFHNWRHVGDRYHRGNS